MKTSTYIPSVAIALLAFSLLTVACNRANTTTTTDSTTTNADATPPVPPIPQNNNSLPSVNDSTKPSATSAPQVQNAQSPGYPIQQLMTNSAPQHP